MTPIASLRAEAVGHHRAGRLADAERAYRACAAAAPEDGAVLVNLARLLRTRGDGDGAVRCARRAIAVWPDCGAAFLDQALVKSASGAHAEALPLFRRVVRLEPDNHGACFAFGTSLLQAGHTAEAADVLHRLAKRQPAYPMVLWNLVVALRRLGRLPEARTLQRSILSITPDDRGAWLNMGVTCGSLGFWGEAEAAARRVLTLEPDQKSARANFALAKKQQGAWPQAITAYQTVLALDPGDGDVWLNCAEAYRHEERWDEAAKAYLRVHALAPHRQSMAFRAEVARQRADAAAQPGTSMLVLDIQSYVDWPALPGVTTHCVPLRQDRDFPTRFGYDVFDGGNWRTAYRNAAAEYPEKALTKHVADARIIHAGAYRDGRPWWQASVVERDGLGSFGGAPDGYINSNFNKLLLLRNPHQMYIDTRDAATIVHEPGQPLVFIENYMNYGHWLLDHLACFGLLDGVVPADKFSVFVPWIFPWQVASLRRLGISEDRIKTTSRRRPGEYVEIHRMNSLYVFSTLPMPERVAYLRNRMLADVPTVPGYEKIVISRRNRLHRRMTNEDEVVQALCDRGFRLVAPEEFSFDEQLAMFRSARVVVSATGSAYTNLVFSSPGTVYIELTGRSVYEKMKDEFIHYQMFEYIGIRHMVMVFENISHVGISEFPVDDGFVVDIGKLMTLVDEL